VPSAASLPPSSKLKVGASGRDMRPPAGTSGSSAGIGTIPRPVGGVGGTTAAWATSRRPQSWQKARLSGLLRPQRSQITPLKGNPQVPVASSAFPGQPNRMEALHAARGPIVSDARAFFPPSHYEETRDLSGGNEQAVPHFLGASRTSGKRRIGNTSVTDFRRTHRAESDNRPRNFSQSLDVPPKLRLNAWSRSPG
jgi:hypothetical protein